MTTKKYTHCVLALDHDRCGKFIKLDDSNTVPYIVKANIVKALADLLTTEVGNSDECEYTLVSYSNRQSDGVNWFLDHVKTSKILDLRINLNHLENVQTAFASLQLKIKHVYDDYFLEDEMTQMFGTAGEDNFNGKAFREYVQEDCKRSLRAAIQKRFPSPNTIIVYIDDEWNMLPTVDEVPVEQNKNPGIGWIQFFGTMIPEQVQWKKCVNPPTKATTPVMRL